MAYYYDIDLVGIPFYDTLTIFHYKNQHKAVVEYEDWNNKHEYIKGALFAALLGRVLNASLEFIRNDENKLTQIRIVDFKTGEFDYMVRKLQQKFGFGLSTELINAENGSVMHITAVSTQIHEQSAFNTICRALEVFIFPEDQRIVDNLNIID